MTFLEDRAEAAAENPELAQQELDHRATVELEARERMDELEAGREEYRAARRAAKKAAKLEDNGDGPEFIYTDE